MNNLKKLEAWRDWHWQMMLKENAESQLDLPLVDAHYIASTTLNNIVVMLKSKSSDDPPKVKGFDHLSYGDWPK